MAKTLIITPKAARDLCPKAEIAAIKAHASGSQVGFRCDILDFFPKNKTSGNKYSSKNKLFDHLFFFLDFLPPKIDISTYLSGCSRISSRSLSKD